MGDILTIEKKWKKKCGRRWIVKWIGTEKTIIKKGTAKEEVL